MAIDDPLQDFPPKLFDFNGGASLDSLVISSALILIYWAFSEVIGSRKTMHRVRFRIQMAMNRLACHDFGRHFSISCNLVERVNKKTWFLSSEDIRIKRKGIDWNRHQNTKNSVDFGHKNFYHLKDGQIEIKNNWLSNYLQYSNQRKMNRLKPSPKYQKFSRFWSQNFYHLKDDQNEIKNNWLSIHLKYSNKKKINRLKPVPKYQKLSRFMSQ